MTVDAILNEAAKLSLDERSDLLRRLERGLAETVENEPLSDEFRAELERRIADADANPGAGVPWEVVRDASLKRVRA